MAKFNLPEGFFVDVRFTFSEAYDKVSEKGNVTVAAESGFAEVIGFNGAESVAMKFGRFGADRGKVAFFVKPAKGGAPAKAKAKAKAKAEAPAPEAPDMEQMFQMFQMFMQQQGK